MRKLKCLWLLSFDQQNWEVKNVSGGTKVPVCASLRQGKLSGREHIHTSQLHNFMMKFSLWHTGNQCILSI